METPLVAECYVVSAFLILFPAPNHSGMIAKCPLKFPTTVGRTGKAREGADKILLGHVAVETPLVAECFVVSLPFSPYLNF